MKKIKLAAAVVPLALLLSACGAANGQEASPTGAVEIYGKTVEMDAALAARVSESFAPDGVLRAPNMLMDPIGLTDEQGKNAGVVPDLVQAIGAKLGLKTETELGSFDAQVPGVISGKYSMSTFTGDFKPRREVLEMVDYLKSGFAYITLAANPTGIAEFDDMCGLRIGTLKGASQEIAAEEFAKECVSKGLPEPDVQGFSNTLLSVPLRAGRVDVIWDNTSTYYGMAKDEPDVYAMPVKPTYNAYLAFGVEKGNTEERDLLRDTLQSLIDDGTYTAILEHWGQKELGISEILLNSDVQE
jgi:polar amino acid transport system substrate-binding protein